MAHTIFLKMGMLAGVLAVFTTGAVAQHEGHHPESEATKPQAQAQAQTEPGASKSGMMGDGMMSGGMMGMMMNVMEERNRQTSAAIDKLAENMAAMQKEKDPAKMKAMMSQQSEMIEQMRGQTTKESGMMQKMSGTKMADCPMTNSDEKPSTK